LSFQVKTVASAPKSKRNATTIQARSPEEEARERQLVDEVVKQVNTLTAAVDIALEILEELGRLEKGIRQKEPGN
jgi:hypothetical protein